MATESKVNNNSVTVSGGFMPLSSSDQSNTVDNPFYKDSNNQKVTNSTTSSSDDVSKATTNLNNSTNSNKSLLDTEVQNALKDLQSATNDWKKSLGLVNKDSNHVFESMSGSSNTVLFEFPNYSKNEGSIFLLMRSIISVSVSTARAKIPIIPLGCSTVDGFALGTKTVAGSIIKTLTYDDELSQVIEIYTQKSLQEKNKNIFDLGYKYKSDLSDSKYNITQKEFDSIMRDDLVPFNIYTYSFSEYTGMKNKCLMNCIYGCTIINEGQTLSIENLITENTLTYVAKYAKLGIDATQEFPSIPSGNSVLTGSKILKRGIKNVQ